jgi:hypothetical protein
MRCNQWQPATSELKQEPFGLAFFIFFLVGMPRQAVLVVPSGDVVAPDVDSGFAKTGGGGGALFGMPIQVHIHMAGREDDGGDGKAWLHSAG